MRVVLDTNTLVSALLFSGVSSRLVPLWQTRRIAMIVSRAILEEYLRVLAYPKFKLEPEEIQALVEGEVLPFVEAVHVRSRLRVVEEDPDDDKFLECAVNGKADRLLTGDRHLLKLHPFRGIAIQTPGDFLAEL